MGLRNILDYFPSLNAIFPKPISEKQHKRDLEEVTEKILARYGFPRDSIMTQEDCDKYVKEGLSYRF